MPPIRMSCVFVYCKDYSNITTNTITSSTLLAVRFTPNVGTPCCSQRTPGHLHIDQNRELHIYLFLPRKNVIVDDGSIHEQLRCECSCERERQKIHILASDPQPGILSPVRHARLRIRTMELAPVGFRICQVADPRLPF